MVKINNTNIVHVVLGHSYLVYFLGLVAGLLFDSVFGIPFVIKNNQTIGLLLLIIGPLLIYSAQATSRSKHYRKTELPFARFARGPYAFTRTPTHLGLGVTMLGLAFLFSSLALLVATVICFFVTRYIFIRKEERILVERYGDDYRAYQRKVRF